MSLNESWHSQRAFILYSHGILSFMISMCYVWAVTRCKIRTSLLYFVCGQWHIYCTTCLRCNINGRFCGCSLTASQDVSGSCFCLYLHSALPRKLAVFPRYSASVRVRWPLPFGFSVLSHVSCSFCYSVGLSVHFPSPLPSSLQCISIHKEVV